jgi:hypothetical protein
MRFTDACCNFAFTSRLKPRQSQSKYTRSCSTLAHTTQTSLENVDIANAPVAASVARAESVPSGGAQWNRVFLGASPRSGTPSPRHSPSETKSWTAFVRFTARSWSSAPISVCISALLSPAGTPTRRGAHSKSEAPCRSALVLANGWRRVRGVGEGARR